MLVNMVKRPIQHDHTKVVLKQPNYQLLLANATLLYHEHCYHTKWYKKFKYIVAAISITRILNNRLPYNAVAMVTIFNPPPPKHCKK